MVDREIQGHLKYDQSKAISSFQLSGFGLIYNTLGFVHDLVLRPSPLLHSFEIMSLLNSHLNKSELTLVHNIL